MQALLFRRSFPVGHTIAGNPNRGRANGTREIHSYLFNITNHIAKLLPHFIQQSQFFVAAGYYLTLINSYILISIKLQQCRPQLFKSRDLCLKSVDDFASLPFIQLFRHLPCLQDWLACGAGSGTRRAIGARFPLWLP